MIWGWSGGGGGCSVWNQDLDINPIYKQNSAPRTRQRRMETTPSCYLFFALHLQKKTQLINMQIQARIALMCRRSANIINSFSSSTSLNKSIHKDI